MALRGCGGCVSLSVPRPTPTHAGKEVASIVGRCGPLRTVLRNSTVGGFSAGNFCQRRQTHRPMADRRQGSYPAPRIKGVLPASGGIRLSFETDPQSTLRPCTEEASSERKISVDNAIAC